MPPSRLRLPVAYVTGPAFFCGMFAVISGGVALTQGPNAVWWPCAAFSAGLLLCALAWKFFPVDWIGDDEIQAIERRDDLEQMAREIDAGTFARNSRIRTKLVWVGVVGVFAMRLALEFGVLDPSGSRDGMTLAGFRLGIWHVFGHDWTGLELLFCCCLLGWLLWMLGRGAMTVVEAQKKPGSRD